MMKNLTLEELHQQIQTQQMQIDLLISAVSGMNNFHAKENSRYEWFGKEVNDRLYQSLELGKGNK